jgi:hypothetical protein
MRLAVKILAVLVIGTMLGVLATWVTVDRIGRSNVSDGPWKTNLAAGSTQSNPYQRAFVAIHGLFALNRTEAVYYTAATDSGGHRLDGSCRYEVTGHEPDARWWSITAYGADEYLIPNTADRYSVVKTTVAREANGGLVVQIGGVASGDNWIPVERGPFTLTLRLYNPGPDIQFDPAHAPLPALTKVACP